MHFSKYLENLREKGDIFPSKNFFKKYRYLYSFSSVFTTCSQLFENLGLAPLELVAGVAGQQAGPAAVLTLRVDRLAPWVRTLQNI